MSQQRPDIVIVGAGLVGCCLALLLSKFEMSVAIYEKKQRQQLVTTGTRNITLALSERAMATFRLISDSFEAEVKAFCMPLAGRMVHRLKKKTARIFMYSPFAHEVLHAVDRSTLQAFFMAHIAAIPSISLCFSSRVSKVNWDTKILEVEVGQNERISVSFDFLFGADGFDSAVRRSMSCGEAISLSSLRYKEIHMQKSHLNETALDANYLHVWPAKDMMIVHLPTTSSFATFTLFYKSKRSNDTDKFFNEVYTELSPRKTKGILMKDCPESSIYHLSCPRFQHKNCGLLVGDAAHAMLPFFGQGVNCGFEDCRIIFEHLDAAPAANLRSLCAIYEKDRLRNTRTIVALSAKNYESMNDAMKTDFSFVKNWFSNLLYRAFPKLYTPLYCMISFRLTPYWDVMQRNRMQRFVFVCIGTTLGILIVSLAATLFYICL